MLQKLTKLKVLRTLIEKEFSQYLSNEDSQELEYILMGVHMAIIDGSDNL